MSSLLEGPLSEFCLLMMHIRETSGNVRHEQGPIVHQSQLVEAISAAFLRDRSGTNPLSVEAIIGTEGGTLVRVDAYEPVQYEQGEGISWQERFELRYPKDVVPI